jgi:hypothetical protein
LNWAACPMKPVLSFIFSSLTAAAERNRRWRGAIEAVGFDASSMMVGTAEAARAPRCAVAARQMILMRTYDGDYHTDVTDLCRLSDRVRAGTERIFFWGATKEIEDLRRHFAADGGDPEAYRHLWLGTATLIEQSDIVGAPTWELSRTGSVSREISALAPNVHAIQEHFRAEPECGKIFTTPRNRTGAPGAKSGVAIQRMHQREILSTFLGFAPWYVMQRGEIELLDYREILRDPLKLRRLPQPRATPGVFSPVELGFIDALLSGLGRAAPARLMLDAPCRPNAEIQSWTLVESSNSEDQCFQPIFLRPANPEEPASGGIEDQLGTPAAGAAACFVVRAPLAGFTRALAHILRSSGFALCAIETPLFCKPWWTAVWARPRQNAPIRAPYYTEVSDLDSMERLVLGYLRKCLVRTWPHLEIEHR